MVELVAFLVLIAPFPATWRKGIFRWFSSNSLITYFHKKRGYLLLFTFILFVDAVVKAVKRSDPESELHTDVAGYLHHHGRDPFAEKFYAQRNVYLTGATLFLLIVLSRFRVILEELFSMEMKQSALLKQAENQQSAYLKQSEEVKELKEKLEKAESESKKLESESKKLRLDNDVLKKQSDNNNESLSRLLEENDSLKKKQGKSSDEDKKSQWKKINQQSK